MINEFESNIYSEELFSVTESEHDEVMQLRAEENDGWQGYAEFSATLESPASENFVVRDGKVYHKPEPRSIGRIGGVEL
jgi:hypothetical protein